MELLNDLFKTNPQASTIEMEFSQLTTISHLLSYLSKFPNLKQLSLRDNRLNDIPENLKMLKNLEALDISNNLISKIDSVLPGLKSLPNLKYLTITLRERNDEQKLIKELPNLEFLNGNSLNRPHKTTINSKVEKLETDQKTSKIQNKNDRQMKTEDISLKQEDLENVATLYDIIRELQREYDQELDKSLADQFDDHVKNIMFDLSNKLKSEFPPHIINTNITKAKYALFEICFTKLIDYATTIDSRLVTVFEGIHDAHALIFKDLSAIINYLDHQNINVKISKSNKDIESILETANKYEKENKILLQEKEEFLQEIKNLEEENKKYLEMIIRYSKGEKTEFSRISPDLLQDKKIETYKMCSNSQGVLTEQEDFSNFQVNNSIAQNIHIEKSQIQQKMPNFKTSGNTLVSIPTTNRTLTLKQLKDFIEEMYDSKIRFDQKYMENKLPRETMEQHMYTYLNQKYGLKNLIIEWATAIVNGIRKFSSEDNDVAVFGKILRNECDEEFRFVQSQVKNTISELLKMYLRGKYPYKHNAEIKELCDAKINGYIYEEECNDIIKYMYNQEDADNLLVKLKKFYIVNNMKIGKEGKKLTREEQIQLEQDKDKPKIEYLFFQKIILDFQLKSHEKFLNKFIYYFKKIDSDNNGLIDEKEFRSLLSLMDINKEESEINRLLQIVDPFNCQQITFSHCVTLFSSEMISHGNATFSILQKISMEEA